MWRAVNNLSIAKKLLFTSLIFIFIVVSLAVTAFSGLTRQKELIAVLYSHRYQELAPNAVITHDIANTHTDLLRLFRTAKVGSNAGIANLLQKKVAALQAVNRLLAEAYDSGRLTTESQKTYRSLSSDLQQYLQLIERVRDAGKSDAALVRQVLAMADECFASIIGELQALKDEEDRSGAITYERSLGAAV